MCILCVFTYSTQHFMVKHQHPTLFKSFSNSLEHIINSNGMTKICYAIGISFTLQVIMRSSSLHLLLCNQVKKSNHWRRWLPLFEEETLEKKIGRKETHHNTHAQPDMIIYCNNLTWVFLSIVKQHGSDCIRADNVGMIAQGKYVL